MAKILVVDDNPVNRKLLVALLSHDGYLTAEAVDGLDALAVARSERPQLVISDIVMPTMDGFEFVRALRGEAALCGTPVIFYTAHYHEHEAQQLAEACDVARVLVKPCAGPDILRAVEQVMAGVSESGRFLLPEGFDRDHLLLVTNKLAEQSDALAASNSRLVALGLLNVELSAMRDSRELLQRACSGARNLIGSRYAVAAMRDQAGEQGFFHVTSGIDVGQGIPPAPDIDAGPLGEVINSRRAWRLDANGAAAGAQTSPGSALPPAYPPASAYLAVPLATPAHCYGWLCLAGKIGAEGFTDDDEQQLQGLGALVGQIHEDIVSRLALQQQTDRLRRDEGHYRHLAEDSAATLQRVYAVMGGVSLIAAQAQDRVDLCSQTCRVLADQGHYRCVIIELTDPANGQFRRIASHGNQPDTAALQRVSIPPRPDPQPLIVNDLRTDPAVPFRQELLDRGCRALAALPLLRGCATIGQLLLISEGEGRFDAAELHLLNEVAQGLSLALMRISGGAAGPASR